VNLPEDHENFREFAGTNKELLKSGNCLICRSGGPAVFLAPPAGKSRNRYAIARELGIGTIAFPT
jgi:hypothetical protein